MSQELSLLLKNLQGHMDVIGEFMENPERILTQYGITGEEKSLLLAKDLSNLNQSGKNCVYKVFDLTLNKIAYLKSAAPLSNIDIYGSDSINRLALEKRILLKTKSLPFTPKLIFDFYIKKHYFTEITAIPAVPLLDFFRKAHVTLPLIINITVEITQKLITLRNLNILYTDISFSNILIDEKSTIYLIDFEYCKLLTEWTPPDIISGCIGFYDQNYNSIDETSIIYSLTALLFYMTHFKKYNDLLINNHEEKLSYLLSTHLVDNSPFTRLYNKGLSHQFSTLEKFYDELINITSDKGKYLK